MKGSIYLIGGGEIRKGEIAEIDNELKEIAGKDSTLVFFGTASGDSPDYIKTIQTVFGEEMKVITPTLDDGIEFSISAINSASIIYLGGGDTDLLLDHFEKWELVKHLETALLRGAHVVGMSAGALALSTWYIDEHNDQMELRRGWGFVPACVLVHANVESKARAEGIWSKSPDAHKTTFIAIGEGAGWRINPVDEGRVGSGNIWKIDGDVD